MFWIDGSIYKGDWEMGVQHGFGMITLTDGTIKKGKFENNVYVGKVTETTEKPKPLLTEDKEEEMKTSQISPLQNKVVLKTKDQNQPIINIK